MKGKPKSRFWGEERWGVVLISSYKELVFAIFCDRKSSPKFLVISHKEEKFVHWLGTVNPLSFLNT